MKISYHAGKRLLERVFEFAKYTHKEVINAMKLIAKDIASIEYKNRKYIPLPSFPGYYGVIVDKTLVTIIPKSYKY